MVWQLTPNTTACLKLQPGRQQDSTKIDYVFFFENYLEGLTAEKSFQIFFFMENSSSRMDWDGTPPEVVGASGKDSFAPSEGSFENEVHLKPKMYVLICKLSIRTSTGSANYPRLNTFNL